MKNAVITKNDFDRNYKWIVKAGIEKEEEFEKTKREYLCRMKF
jgi:hypothetical protein